MKIKPLIGRRIRIGRRLHVNQPQERLRNENEDNTKMQMTQSLSQYSENNTKIWSKNIPDQFNHVSSSCLPSHFAISLICINLG